MAKTQQQPEAEIQQSTEPTGRRGLLGKLKIAGIVAALIVAECAVAWVYIPSAAEVQARAEAEAGLQAAEEPLDSVPESQNERMLEVDLGEYAVTSYQPDSNTVLRIDFRLFGTVREADNDDFLDRLALSENRIRQEVIVTTRNSEVTDLTDPNLSLLKRRILDTLNRTLGKPLLAEVGFGDFSFIEQ